MILKLTSYPRWPFQRQFPRGGLSRALHDYTLRQVQAWGVDGIRVRVRLNAAPTNSSTRPYALLDTPEVAGSGDWADQAKANANDGTLVK
jgi:hypothetical protein